MCGHVTDAANVGEHHAQVPLLVRQRARERLRRGVEHAISHALGLAQRRAGADAWPGGNCAAVTPGKGAARGSAARTREHEDVVALRRVLDLAVDLHCAPRRPSHSSPSDRNAGARGAGRGGRGAPGSKGLPDAKMARPSVHLYASSAVHSALAVGLESGNTMGCSVCLAISRTTSSENTPRQAVSPSRMVGCNAHRERRGRMGSAGGRGISGHHCTAAPWPSPRSAGGTGSCPRRAARRSAARP